VCERRPKICLLWLHSENSLVIAIVVRGSSAGIDCKSDLGFNHNFESLEYADSKPSLKQMIRKVFTGH